MLFADLLSLHLVTFLTFFILVYVTFLAADACLSWSLPSTTEQQVSPHRLPMQYWPRITDQAFFKHSLHTNSISNSAILRNNYISLLSNLCACVHVKKNGIVKEAIVLQWAVRIASCDFETGKSDGLVHCSVKMLLFCVKTIMKESRKDELAHLKKKKKEKHFGRLATFWFGTFAMLFSATGCVVCHENTRRWTVGCYNGL